MKNSKKDPHFKDRGDAVFITFLFSLALILLITGIVLDFGKGTVARTNYTSIAQTSSQAAVKKINAKGSLGAASYKEFIEDYYLKAHGVPYTDQKHFTGEFSSGCKLNVPGKAPFDYTGPYFKIALSNRRGSSNTKDPLENSKNITYVEGTGRAVMGKLNDLDKELRKSGANYKVLEAEVYEVEPNFMLSMAGMDCQQFNIRISAVAFGSQEDLK